MSCTDCAANIETRHGGLACEDCVTVNHWQCAGCDQWYRDGETCDDCVTCARCDATVPEDDTVETTTGSTICEECRDDWFWQCDECLGWNRDGQRCRNGCCANICDCDDCGSGGGLIRSYAYKPRPVFHGTGPLFLGPEIEVETPSYAVGDCAKIAHSHLGELGYLKADGSLGYGFEIVTHPMSYPWAMANFPWKMLSRLHQAGGRATANTGLHVHVSRAGFASPCHTYRWMKFIYRNERQVTTLARRSSPTWAAFTASDRQAAKDYAKGAIGGRYRAINTGNPDTFELRMFASSLNAGRVQAALGFAAASVEYTRALTAAAITQAGGWTWPAFVTWLRAQPDYAPLTRQLEDLRCVC